MGARSRALDGIIAIAAVLAIAGCSDEAGVLGGPADARAGARGDARTDADAGGRSCERPYVSPPDEIICGEPDQVLTLTLPGAVEQVEGCTRFRGGIHLPDASRPDRLAPLHALRRLDGRFTIFRNHALEDLRDLANLESVGGMFSIRIDDSDGLFTSVDGLSSLCEVGSLQLDFNRWLQRLDGLSALEVVRGDVQITGNAELSSAEIDALLDRVRVEGAIEVADNGG